MVTVPEATAILLLDVPTNSRLSLWKVVAMSPVLHVLPVEKFHVLVLTCSMSLPPLSEVVTTTELMRAPEVVNISTTVCSGVDVE